MSDTAANVLAGTADATNVVILDDFNSVIISDAATVAQITDINADLTAETTGGAGLTEVATGYTLTDTQANLVAANGANGIVDDAGTVNISDASTVAEVTAIKTAMDQNGAASVQGTTLNYSLEDTAALINAAAAAYKTGATSISITDATVTVAAATQMTALAKFDGVYTVSDTVANLVGETAAADVDRLNAAVSVTVADSVANLEAANGVTTIAAATTDNVAVTDTLANLTTSRTGGTAVAAATSITISDTDLDVGDATNVNALAALATTTYTIVDANADLVTAINATGGGGVNENGAITTLLDGATQINVDTNDGTAALDGAISVAQYNVLDAATTSTIRANITDTVANLSGATGATALAAVIANGDTLTISDTAANVAQVTTLNTAGAAIGALDITDTAANITAAAEAVLTGSNSVTVSDKGTVTHTAAALVAIYGAAGSQYGNYIIQDTAANVVANIGGNAGLANFSQGITLTGDDATVAQATTIQSTTTMGSATVYSIEDSSANIAGGAAAALNGAVNLTANDAATVAQASTINAATNSGSTSYAVTDTPANLATAVAASVAGIENATGTVTSNAVATVAQADVFAAFTKAVVYSVTDTVANLGGATAAALNEAVNIVGTGASTVANATVAINATNSGTTTLAGVTDTAQCTHVEHGC